MSRMLYVMEGVGCGKSCGRAKGGEGGEFLTPALTGFNHSI